MFNQADVLPGAFSAGVGGLLNSPIAGSACGSSVAGHDLVCSAESSEVREWSLGVVQEIDAAAMSLWVQYDHFDASGSGCTFGFNASDTGCVVVPGFETIAKSSLDSEQIVKFGGLINF